MAGKTQVSWMWWFILLCFLFNTISFPDENGKLPSFSSKTFTLDSDLFSDMFQYNL